MLLTDIIKKIDIEYKVLSFNSFNDITDIVHNSRKSNQQTIFTAIKGFKTDGHLFINDCYQNGCRDFIIEDESKIGKNILNDSTVIVVKNTRRALGKMSAILFDFPADKLKIVGVTGTKGKTTVTTLIHHIINNEKKTSMFSTVKNYIAGEYFDAQRTTMESNELSRLLKRSFDKNDKVSVIEVSSHAVTLDRIIGINFDVGVFTSFSQDHLDLYGSMDKYFDAKLGFFRMLNNSTKENKIAVINMDDPRGGDVVSIVSDDVRAIKVGSQENCDYYIKNFQLIDKGMKIKLYNNSKEYEFVTQMRGKFNITNISLAIAVVMELGFSYEKIKTALENFKGVDGRFEIIQNEPFTIIIDYAHSPGSLEKILIEAKALSKNRVLLVFGCTGERDRDKRQIMGKIASEYSDYTIITNDDTYSEDPFKIAKEVEVGFLESDKTLDNDYLIILDRKDAIRNIIEKAKNGDVIVIAGMGHEKVQILANGSVPYNDKETVLGLLKQPDV